MKVAVLGLGVGYALCCALAETGHDVVGIDISQEVVRNPRRERSVETLLEKAGGIIGKHLTLTTDSSAIAACETIIVCVSTGDEKKLVLGHVEGAIRECLRLLRNRSSKPTIMVYSTLPFGSSKRIQEIFREENTKIDQDVSYCYMPLMIAQGTTADDFVNPPFIAFGSYSQESAERMREFYLAFIRRSVLFKGKPPPCFVTTPEVAELAKLVANAFLSTKISFSNMVSRLCESEGVDGRALLEIVGSDWRIGNAMLKPGYSFGGACFPRDLESLIDSFKEGGVACQILEAARDVNVERVGDPARIMEASSISGGNVLILGTAYKSGISDTRGSPSLALAELLRDRGYNVSTYDPNIDVYVDLDKLVREADVVIVATKEQAFATLGNVTGESKVKVIVDLAGLIKINNLQSGIRLYKAGLGWVS